MWFLLASPFITALLSFMILKGFVTYDYYDERIREAMLYIYGVIFAFWMLIGFCTCSGIFILAPISDREFKLRGLMNYIGMNSLAYYTGNFIVDYVLYLIPSLGFIILLFPMKIEAFTNSCGTILLILLCFGLALISLTYFVSFLFKTSATAFRQIGVMYLLIGYIIPNTVSGIVMVTAGVTVYNIVRTILLLDPFYPFY